MRTVFLLLLGLLAGEALAKGEAVSFQAADGVTIYGDLYRAPDRGVDAPLILLFHQGAGSAQGEYRPLVVRLLEAGYHALAIDQRRGGERLGGVNRTVAALDGEPVPYCDVYPDLLAAMDYADKRGFDGPRIAWGSSYSAALAIRLAHEFPERVSAVLAFSPASGEPMAGCEPHRYSAELRVPLLALRPAREMEIDSVREQLERLRTQGHATHVADPGVHGSSMLNADRVGAGTAATWQVVLDFIAAHT